MRSFKIKNILWILAFMVMITAFLPLFNNHVRFNIGVNSYWSMLCVASILITSSRILKDKLLLYVFFYLIFFVYILGNTLWSNLPEWNKDAGKDTLFFIAPITLYSYFTLTGNYRGLAVLMKWTLIFIGLTCIMTIYSASIDPLYARTGRNYASDDPMSFSKLGGGGYGFAESLLCLFPMIIYYFRNSRKTPFSKPVIILFGILAFVALLRMQWFGPIIMSVFVIIIAFLGVKNLKISIVFIGIFLILVISIPKSVYTSLLKRTSRYFDAESEVYFKLNDMASFIEIGEVNEETGVGSRAERYPLLWEGFKANPVTGFYNSNSSRDITPGGHLYWMNRLTIYGLFGFLPFVFIFYLYIKRIIKHFDKEFTFYFLLSIFAGLGLGLIKNLTGKDFWIMIFFIIPSLYYLPLLKKSKASIIEKNYSGD